jgi:hypothetical protein
MMRALPIGFIPTSPLGETFAPTCEKHGVAGVDEYVALRGVDRRAFEEDWTASAKHIVTKTGVVELRRIQQVRRRVILCLQKSANPVSAREVSIAIGESVRLTRFHLQNLVSESFASRIDGHDGEYEFVANPHADPDMLVEKVGGRTRQPRSQVISLIRDFKAKEGRLPSASECNKPANRGRLPSYSAVLKNLNVRNWQQARLELDRVLATAA